MKKRILMDFIKDNAGYAFVFYLSIGIIILYYKMTAGISDIVYPVTIVSTIFIIHLFIQGVKYYSFNMNIHDSVNVEDKLFERTNQQKYFNEELQSMKNRYLKEISRINSKSNSYRYFFSQWLHNMKTPVSIISLVVQKLQNECIGETKNEDKNEMKILIHEIEEENNKLHNGLEQLLNILRMEEFVRDYEPEAVDIIKSLKDIINTKKSLFIYNNVFPQVECPEGNINVLTDEKWNKFMLEQIINNAVKYSAEKGKKKRIKFIIEKIDSYIQLKICDEGIGIPKSDIKRVFEPFFTGDNGRKYRDASGIGLYICSLLAKNLQHKIDIQSEVGKGTTVTVSYFLNS